MTRRRASRVFGAVASALALSLVATSAPAARADDYPSWNDVQSARNSQAATQALVDRLNTTLDDAQTRAASLSAAALTTAAAATQARADADTATTRAQQLAADVDAASARLAQARRTVGALAAARQRSDAGASPVLRLLTDADPSNLLQRLAAIDRIEGTWRGAVDAAQTDANLAASLRSQADAAEAERARLAAAADTAAADATAAAASESAAVSSLRQQVDTMYAQLASLKSTSADVERRYRLGLQVASQPQNPGGTGSAGSGGSSGGGSGGSSGGGSGGGGSYGVVVDPAGAKAYARGAIGSYGWGEDQFSCLVLLWNRESGWRANALNPGSGAYGIPQSLPGEKMAAAGPDWRTNGATQIDWGLSYINGQYGSPCAAWDHSQRTDWY